MWSLRVGQTWAGEPLPDEQQARVRLSMTSEGLGIHIDSPWYDDPVPTGPPGLLDGLWEYEVVEVFIASASCPERYIELEFGPLGHRLGLAFSGVRCRASEPFDFAFDAKPKGKRWEGRAHVETVRLPEPPWLLNAFALNGTGTQRRYLVAHALPGDSPDFHQPTAFPRGEYVSHPSGEKR